MKKRPRKRRAAVDFSKKRPIHRLLTRLREEAGLSKTEFADKLGVHRTAPSHWEDGDTAPHTKYLPDAAKILKTPVDDLLAAYLYPKAA